MHCRVCLVASCFHSIRATGSRSTKKTSRPKGNNSSSPLKAFPQAGKPQKFSSIYTTFQYFQPPNAQGTTSVHCLTASWESLWTLLFLSSPRSSLSALLKGSEGCSPAGIHPQNQSSYIAPDKAFCPTPLPFPNYNSKCWMQTHVVTNWVTFI